MQKILFILLLLSIQAFSGELLLATTYPLYYPLKFMAEGKFDVDVLIKNQADVHHYELKPDDLRRIRKARGFFYLGVESWEKRVARNIPESKSFELKGEIQFLKTGRHLDPHLWLSPSSFRPLVENTRQALIRLDPVNSEHYKKRAEEYLKKLQELEAEYRSVLSNCKDRTLVITHQSAAYLARDYSLELVGLRGVHAEEEPRPSELRKMVEKVKNSKVRTIFSEMGHDESLARRIAKEVGARTISLNTSLFPENPSDDYFSIMRRNLDRLAEGLNCQTR